jgi:hypothetical protein
MSFLRNFTAAVVNNVFDMETGRAKSAAAQERHERLVALAAYPEWSEFRGLIGGERQKALGELMTATDMVQAASAQKVINVLDELVKQTKPTEGE